MKDLKRGELRNAWRMALKTYMLPRLTRVWAEEGRRDFPRWYVNVTSGAHRKKRLSISVTTPQLHTVPRRLALYEGLEVSGF